MSNKTNGGLFVVGMVIGGAIGTVAGILIAPRTGRETRTILGKSLEALPEMAEDITSSVQLQADRLSESARRNWDDTLVRLRESLAAGIEATQLGEESLDNQLKQSNRSNHL
ncbi:MAG: hypothetical protein N5P05_001699 [Chroococcopsis gigantea SAG 12.99]|jgi:gas vesicle protein|nr:YtxH domain-containing protein [Chlorogloea purpurea SAG 13.99]MDV3000093.1 hypothetical protein [Chroococcopsis gigantea SAG 12.99]